MNKEEYLKFLESQGADYVWQFTKQDMGFENAFNSTKLFEEWKYISNKSEDLANFYKTKHREYNLIDNYRTLIIAQLYGLITKNKSQYKDEEITPIYNKIAISNNPKQFSAYVSEQILKIKLPAIIDSRAGQQKDRHVFPVIFIYQVLRKLNKKLSIRDLFTFVMTMNFHSDLDKSIDLINEKNSLKISDKLFEEYKSRSRVLALLRNINLFNIDSDFISINKMYSEDMDSFIKNNSFYKDESLKDEIKYKSFLINLSDFQINLKEHLIINEDFLNSSIKEDNDYVVDVNNVDVGSLDANKLNQAYNKPPVIQDVNKSESRRNIDVGKLAIVNAKFKCEFNEEHKTFICRVTKNNFVEAHHLIPMQYQTIFWQKYKKNLDCVQNIVPLCPVCHRALHHGTLDVKKVILDKIYDIKSKSLKEIGLEISKEELNNYYF